MTKEEKVKLIKEGGCSWCAASPSRCVKNAQEAKITRLVDLALAFVKMNNK